MALVMFHLLAFHSQMDGTLAASKTTTQPNHAISNLILMEIIVVDDDHIITIDTGDGWNERRGTDSQDERIDALLLNIFRRNGSLQSGNAGTHHHHLLALTGRQYLHALYLTTD